SVYNESSSSTEKEGRSKTYSKHNSVIPDSLSCLHRDAVKQTRSTCTTAITTSTVYYKCRQCNRLFVSLTTVQQHRLTMHAANSNLIGCGLCGVVYSTEQDAKSCFSN